MNRLSVVDEMFLRTHRGLGTPIVMQGLWRTTDVVEPELLWGIHERLRRGPLGRRVVRARVPGARPRWQPTTRAYPLAYPSTPIPRDGVLEWATTQTPDLDPEHHPGWRMSAANTDDGGTVVSLVCSHVLADARGLALAVDEALSGTPVTPPSPVHSDWSDAYHQWTTVLDGTARALLHATPPQVGAQAPARARPHGQPRTAIVQAPAGAWDAAAQRAGGSPNSLFVSVVTHILWAATPAGPLDVALPVDLRTGAEVGNHMTMAEITVAPGDSPALIREKSRAAYERPMTAPRGFPEELLQVVPQRLAYLLSRGAGERDVLCSNIGTLPDSLACLGAHRADGIATRAIHPGLDGARMPRTRLSGYLCRSGTESALSLVALDPRIAETDAALAVLAREQLNMRGVTATAW